ncbi:MAG: transporter [Nonomuraea muscovyensis]|nr:transporter [Nonomuraea muscovyensis]
MRPWARMRARLPLRLARTAAFAAVCVTLATLAHATGGGSLPSPGQVALGLAAVFAATLALSGRERGSATINGVLVAAQAGLHELFGSADGSAYVAPHTTGTATLPGTGLAVLPGASGPVLLPGHAAGGLGSQAGMLLAHLAATLVTGWWLARGEAALWALLRRLGSHLHHRLDRRLTPLRPPSLMQVRVAPVVRTRPVPVAPALLHSAARRGPPHPA